MLCRTLFALLISLTAASSAYSQEWARKMFEVTSHDFGTVAKGGKAEFQFVFSNIFLEDVHVQSARVSCHCTSVRVDQPETLKTYQKAAITAWINSDSYLGQRQATITVTFDKPFYAEVQLQVRAYVRNDVQFTPGSVQLGTIDQGTESTQRVGVSYGGDRMDWQVLGVRSPSPSLRAEVLQTGRSGNQAWYDLIVHVDKNAPAGYLRDHLVLMTNDLQQMQIPVLVEGRVQAALSVSPSSLLLGVVQPQQKVTRQLVVQGNRPFRILGVTSDDPGFSFKETGPQPEGKVHLVQVTYTAGKQSGKVTGMIRIATDLNGTPQQVPASALISENGAVTQK